MSLLQKEQYRREYGCLYYRKNKFGECTAIDVSIIEGLELVESTAIDVSIIEGLELVEYIAINVSIIEGL